MALRCLAVALCLALSGASRTRRPGPASGPGPVAKAWRACPRLFLALAARGGAQEFPILHLRDVLGEADGNGDGVVDKSEFLLVAREVASSDSDVDLETELSWFEGLFDRADVDGDGVLTRYEAEFLDHLARTDILGTFHDVVDAIYESAFIWLTSLSQVHALASLVLEVSERLNFETTSMERIGELAQQISESDVLFEGVGPEGIEWLQLLVGYMDLDRDEALEREELEFLRFAATQALRSVGDVLAGAEDEVWEEARRRPLTRRCGRGGCPRGDGDADGDGRISREEFLDASLEARPDGAATDPAVQLFVAADGNRDGVLDRAELGTPCRSLRPLGDPRAVRAWPWAAFRLRLCVCVCACVSAGPRSPTCASVRRAWAPSAGSGLYR